MDLIKHAIRFLPTTESTRVQTSVPTQYLSLQASSWDSGCCWTQVISALLPLPSVSLSNSFRCCDLDCEQVLSDGVSGETNLTLKLNYEQLHLCLKRFISASILEQQIPNDLFLHTSPPAKARTAEKQPYRAFLSPKAKLLLAIGTRGLSIFFRSFQNFNMQNS